MFYDVFIGLCNQKNISPSKAAGEIGFNKSSISNWKKNGYTPRKEIAVKIAEYFNVSVDYLLTGDEKENAPSKERALTPTQKEFIDLLDAMPEDKQQMLLQMIKALVAGM